MNAHQLLLPLLCSLALAGCAPAVAPTPEEEGEPAPATSALARSSPPDGAVLSSPPESLTLTFAQPVRLVEVTVTGSDGLTMPMMVTPAGAQLRYSLPLSGLERSAYTVSWRALAEDGRSLSGNFRFTIR